MEHGSPGRQERARGELDERRLNPRVRDRQPGDESLDRGQQVQGQCRFRRGAERAHPPAGSQRGSLVPQSQSPRAALIMRAGRSSIVRIIAAALLGATAGVAGFTTQSSQANRPFPPGVQKVSDESPPLSPADELKTFFMAPGYHLELVAAEPLIQDPIVITWDPDGRLWAVEMPGFVKNLGAVEPNLDPIGRIVVLE